MRHKRLIWQMYSSQLIVTLLALLAMFLDSHHAMRTFQVKQTASGLEARGRLIQESIIALLDHGDLPTLRAFCGKAGENSATRITVIALDGTVLADSDEDPERMENHGDRPEIVAALAGRISPSLRFSRTLQENMMYVAIPLHLGDQTLAVLRTAIPVTFIDRALQEISRRIVWACLIIVVLVALASWLLARRISHPLEKMRLGAERFADGEFAHKMPEEGSAEVASLARAMNAMAAQLDARIKTMVQQHSQLEAVFSSMTEGVLTVDAEEQIVEVNAAGARILNVTPDHIKGKNILLAIRNTALQRFVSEALAGPTPVEGAIDLTDNMGSARHFYAHGTRLQDATGAVNGALIVINDVTNLRRLEQMRRDFVANASHELKSPITSIAGFAETLLDGAIDEPKDARRFAEIIASQAKRLHAIIDDLLALSRLEQEVERKEVKLRPTPLTTPLRAAIQSCNHKAATKNIALNLQCDEALMAQLNPNLMEQAVGNLIDNAVKYSPEGSTVTVSAAQTANGTSITVHDNGPGIPAGEQGRIFERFYRVDKARGNAMGSTGLGLAIVKHIVQAHGGEIRVTSEPGKGSTFTILLPPA